MDYSLRSLISNNLLSDHPPYLTREILIARAKLLWQEENIICSLTLFNRLSEESNSSEIAELDIMYEEGEIETLFNELDYIS